MPVCFSLAWLLLIGRSELTRPIPQRERWQAIMVVGVFVVLVLLSVLFSVLFPSRSDIAEAVKSVMYHPAFVLFLWIFWLWAIYRRWQHVKVADAQP
jgi:protein-S-isoprenylcysteine O-methyltransferase Ste14